MANPFVPAPNTVQVNIRYLESNQLIENTLYFHKASAWSQADLQACADAAFDHWSQVVMPDLSNGLHMIGTRVVDLTTQTSGAAEHVETADGQNNSGIALPNNVAFCLKFATASRGRSFRGRIYLPGLVGTQIASGSTSTLSATAGDVLLEDVQTAIGAIADDTGAEHVVVSRFSNGAARTTALSTPVTSISYTDLNCDSQRRRLPGRGV